MAEEKIYVTRSSMPAYEEYCEMIKPLWDSHFLTNMGTFHRQFEEEIKKYLDVPNVSLMVNGHMALEMIIQSYNFPKGSEVITTPFTFISTTHAIVRNGLKPVYCDVNRENGTIDVSKIEELITDKTVAILPVHVYGNICDVRGIKEIADKYNLKVIYDAAHAFGEVYEGVGVGNFGDASIFSFHATKVFNSIEGGAVTFADPLIYEKLYNLKNFGIRGEESVVDVGANAKMNEFAAAMGLCNLKNIDKVIQERKERYEYYKRGLEQIKGISFFKMNENLVANYSYFPVLIDEDYKMTRDELYLKLKENNIYSRKYFYPLCSDMECFGDTYKNASLDVARDLSNRVLVLPFHAELDYEIIDKIIETLDGGNDK